MATSATQTGPAPTSGAKTSSVHGKTGRFPTDPEAPGKSGAGADQPGDGHPGASQWGTVRNTVQELREQVSFLVAAKLDAIKLLIRRIVLLAIVGVVGLLAAGTVVITSVVLLLQGAARGIGVALGNLWLGQVIVGAGILLLLAVGALIGMKLLTASAKRATIRKYDTRKTQQRVRFGRDVEGNTDGR